MLTSALVCRNMDERIGARASMESIIRAVEGTKSTAEISFEGMRITLPGVNSYIEITGKVTFTARPVHEKSRD